MTLADPVTVYGRARRLASRYCYGAMHHLERINSFDANVGYEALQIKELQLKNDWEIVIIFLTRLRRCVYYISQVPEFRTEGEAGLDLFDSEVPKLKPLRDFEEHFDDYSLGKGQKKDFEWGHLETFSYGPDGFSNGVGEITSSASKKAALVAWKTLTDLEPKAKRLGYRTWDDRYGQKVATGE